MKRYKKPLIILLSLLPYLTVFLFAMYSPSDPDLGWHLKYGEYFVQHGSILRDNTFSTLMPDYQWANTSWLTDVLTYVTYAAGGFFGLTLLSSLIVTLTFFFFSRVAKLTLWDQAFLFPLLLYLVQPINAVSFRGQQITLLFLGIMFYLISFYPKNKKTFLLLIPLFLLWANLHGQFIFGLALFAGWIFMYLLVNIISSLSERRESKGKKRLTFDFAQAKKLPKLILSQKKDIAFLAGIFLASALVTIINPFGIGIHTAAISHFGSPLLKNIGEYLPFNMLSEPWWNQVIVGIGIVTGFIFLLLKGNLKSRIPMLVLGLIVYALSFGVRRYAWPAYYMVLPMLQPIARFLKPDNKKTEFIMTVIFLLVLFGIALSSRFPFTKYVTFNWNDYCKSNSVSCSPKSAEFLIEKNLTENVYTLYGWGGWLIWNYPEIKPVIDGRMHLWRDPNGYSAFVDYYAYEQNFEDIDDSQYNIVYISTEKPVYDRLLELVKQKRWKMVYEDDFSAIFVRNKQVATSQPE